LRGGALAARRAFISLVFLTALMPATPAQAAFPGTNGKIAFASNRAEPNPSGCGQSCNYEIYTIDPDGTDLTRLTFDSAPDENPAWSPDGKKIVFTRGPSQPDIWVMNADGSGQTNLTNGAEPFVHQGPAWSPDGTRIVFTDGTDLWVMNADGSGAAQLAPAASAHDPSWAADGSLIAYTEVFVISARAPDGTGYHFIAEDAHLANSPDWSPDVTKVAYGAIDNDGSGRIWVVDADGSNPHVISTPNHRAPSWSPDGSRIAVERLPGDLATMNTDGTGETPLTSNASPIRDLMPAWQPLPVNTYPRPRGATPIVISLVPAYAACSAPNRTHGAPLAFPSCTPPALESQYLTVGTPDANGKRTTMEASLLLRVVTGASSDVRITARVNNVFKNDLTDYAGGLRARLPLQITDRDNSPSPGGPGAGTVQEVPFEFDLACTPTADTTIGSDCPVATSANALVPGSVTADLRAIWQIGQAQVYDGGADGNPVTADNTLYLRQGVFIP
jgi:Tol biopolymer transport system component